MILDLPKVYPITDVHLSGLSHAEQVARLIEGGATLIQLRDKHSTPRDFYQAAAAALQIARQHNVRIMINDRVDIALALETDGVHLGQTDVPVTAARRLLGPNAIIGFSTHNLEQAQRAMTLPIDYLACGPIFPTSMKEDPDPVTGLSLLRKVRNMSGALPLVAIGGIHFANALEVLRAGADSLAIISDLLSNPGQISENIKKMLKLTPEKPT